MSRDRSIIKEELRKEIMAFFSHIAPDAYHIDDAAYMLGIKGAKEMNLYFTCMNELLSEKILQTKDNEYYSFSEEVKDDNLILEGVFKRYRDNFGFVLDTPAGDVFVDSAHDKRAMNNDKVRVKIIEPKSGKRNAQGEIVEILEHANKRIVGTFHREQHFGFVVPDNERLGGDIYINLKDSMEARSTAKVLVEIVAWADETHKKAEGKIVQILGYKGTPGLDVTCIVVEHDIPTEFSEACLHETEKLSMQVKEDPMRLDLRKEMMITIDGEDAKDLDDAVSIKKLENGNYQLGVHIADVSHYVRPMSAIDKDAYARGTSVYLVDRVIPMLPEKLSNGICSLNVGEDRYAMTCLMEINEEGTVVSSTIRPSMIHIDRRCNYDEVYKALTENIIPDNLKPFMPMIQDLYALMQILNQMRIKRGALDFDIPEYKVVVDTDGTPLRVVKRTRTIAERIIEECMLIANETVATFLEKQDAPSVYRIHEEPKEEKLDMVKQIMNYLGKPFEMKGDTLHPRDYQILLKEVEGTDIENVAEMMVLRSMQQAKYTVPNRGHFGLASKCYTHFTSPIRRYPDLMIHRLIKHAIGWHSGYTKRDAEESYLEKAASHSSEMEQRAVATEREVDDFKKAEYMVPYIGQSFDGVVTSITNFGMFVELPNGINGLVSIAMMKDDFYVFDEEHFLLVGRHTGKKYCLGEKVVITVFAVDVGRSQIDFVLGDVDPRTLTNLQREKEHRKNGRFPRRPSRQKENRGDHQRPRRQGKRKPVAKGKRKLKKTRKRR